MLVNFIFMHIPDFYSWLSSFSLSSGFTLMDFCISCFVVTILVGVVLPWFGGGDD